MASVTSQVPAVLSYLVSLFQNAATLGQATPPVSVYDGPVTTEEASTLLLWVGLEDPDNANAELAAESDRAYSSLAGAGETITVHCVAEAWSGLDTVAAIRTTVYGIVSAAETLVRADRGGFGATPGMTADPAAFARSELRQNNTDRGTQARVNFTIVVKSY